MATYYVHKGVGNNANTGTSWAQAFATIGKAVSTAGVNDTVYVRAGTTPYYERLPINKNGQKWIADNTNGQPILDAQYHDALANKNLSTTPPGTYIVQKTGPLNYPALVTMPANDCVIDGFKVCNVAGRGFTVTGSRNTIRNCWVDWTYTNGIMIVSEGGSPSSSCSDNLVDSTEVTRCSVAVYAPADQANGWGRPWDVICATKNSIRTTFRNLRVHHNHAEGIVMGAGSKYGVVEYCGSWNNEHMCYYLNNAEDATFRFNWGFSTGHPEVLRGGKHASECLVISEEDNSASGAVRNLRIYGNIFVGGRWVMTLARRGKLLDSGLYNQETQLINGYIGFNTLIGLPGVTQDVINGRTLPYRAHKEFIFENNILYAPSGVGVVDTDGMGQGKGRGNVFFRPGGVGSLPGWINGPGTVIGDPQLINATAAITDNGGVRDKPPTGGNNFNRNNYKIGAGASPAINNALVTYPFNTVTGPSEARTTDHFGATRQSPDIGGHEYDGQVSNSVTAAFTHTPSATTLVEGTAVTFTNTSYAGGTASITGQTWRVRKAGTIVHTVTTANMSYTFATDGAYTVELTVTATGGLTDSETVAFTVNDPAPGVVVTAAFTASPSATTIQQGTAVTFTGTSTVQNGTLASQAWAILSMPGEGSVASGTGATYSYTFATAGTFRVRLTATAATGQTDTEVRDYTVTPVTSVTVDASFTSSDGDNMVIAGETVTFTNTSTASEAVASYTWLVLLLGTGEGGQTFTTEHLTHTFDTPGRYRVQLLVVTTSGASDSTHIEVIVQSQATTGEDWLVVPHAFAVETVTGTQTVTAVALGDKTPRGVHIILTAATAAGTAATGALWSEGAASESAQWVHCRFSAHGEGTTKAWRRRSNSSVIMTIDGTGAKTGEARFLRFIPGGMEIDIVDGFPAGYRAVAVFYAGDACQFWAGSRTLGAEDAPVNVTTGFAQDVVYMMSSWAAGEDTAEADADYSRGFAVREGAQAHFRNSDRHNSDESFLVTRLQPRIGSSANGDDGYTSIEAGEFTSTGFSVTPRSSALPRDASLFAFRAGAYRVGLDVINLPTSGALDLALEYEPQAVLALTSTFGATTTNTGGQIGGPDAEGQGFYVQSIHGPAAASLSIASDNGVGTSVTRSLMAADFRAVAPDGADLWHGAGALDVDAFGVATWTDQPAAAYRMIILSLERGTDIVVEPEDPVADWTAQIDINAETGRAAVWFDASISNGMGETIDTYAWVFGDGTTSDEVAPFKLYERPGIYSVSLTVTTAAGSNTKTVTSYVVIPETERASFWVGMPEPKTSGGRTENEIDEFGNQTHAIRFDGWAHFKALSAAEVVEFLAMPTDDAYALWAYDTENHRVIIKEPDGSVWVVQASPI